MSSAVDGGWSAIDLIEAKKMGGAHSASAIAALIRAYTAGSVPDYQMAAWLMAVRLRGFSLDETRALTAALVESGRSFNWEGMSGPVVDKHSTGGVGDKTSLVVAPLAAACGLAVAKISGRGLGFTGGTLDKLESIPGLRVDLDADAFVRQVRDVGAAIVAQSADFVPADGKLYALRDATGTVDSPPLIAASVMSKKLAAGAGAIVLDVKAGSGAFMRDFDSAIALAELMVEIGAAAGRKVRAFVTGMDQPLGLAVGHSLEVSEALATLRGRGPADLTELSLTIVSALIRDSGLRTAPRAARQRAEAALDSGEAESKFREMVAAQGGDLDGFERKPPHAELPVKRAIVCQTGGFLARLDAAAVARALRCLGGVRANKGEDLDRAVGLQFTRKVGEAVAAGEEIGVVYARDVDQAEGALQALREGLEVASQPPAVPQLILGQVAR